MILLALLSSVAPAVSLPALPPADNEVVVTGRRFSELERRWRECLKQSCPPPEEMRRAIAYAEGQLAVGDYRGSWRTLRKAKSRNVRHARDYPTEVAQVARATSRLAGLNGEPEVSRIAAVSTVDALKSGLRSGDPRVLLAQLDVGDAFIPEGRAESAFAQYGRVASTARRQGLPEIAMEAEFRSALWMTRLSSAYGNGGYIVSARKALERIIASHDPFAARYRDQARLLRINLLAPSKRAVEMDRLIPTLAPRPADKPLLVFAPLIDTDRLTVAPANSASAQQWVNVSYRIGPDGRVRDSVATRGGAGLDPELAKAAVAATLKRRYAPLAMGPTEDSPYRYARYTFVFDTLPAGTSSEQMLRGSPIAPNEARQQGTSDAKSQVRPGTSGEIVTRIPRYRSIPRIDVFELGSDLARLDPKTT